MEKRESLGALIKNLRKENNLTQAELATRSQISQGLIAQYESGKRKPKPDTLNKLADALGYNVGIFLSSEIEIPESSTGEKIKFYRETRCFTQKILSDLTNISVQRINDIENEQGSPSIDELCILADTLNIHVTFLIDTSDPYLRNRSNQKLSQRTPAQITVEEKDILVLYSKLNSYGKESVIKFLASLTQNKYYTKIDDLNTEHVI